MSIFKEKIQINAPGQSKFDLSHERKFTLDMGKLVPIMVQETLPGDSFRVDSNFLLRVAPMVAPLFHTIDVYTHYFFVPNRIIWSEWETFLTGGADGLQAPVHPEIQWGNGTLGPAIEKSSLADYLGLPFATEPAGSNLALQVNELPFRAYLEIYNEYYRDENLVPRINYSKASGVRPYTDPEWLELTTLRLRAWEKDYFTTALPFAQKGNPAGAPVTIPNPANISGGINPSSLLPSAAGPLTVGPGGAIQDSTSQGVRIDNDATVLITELRKATRLQEFLEAAARGGHRLTEWVLHVFGVKSSDERLQRPEYLGGGRSPVQISEVLSNFQFSGDAEGKPQGNMSGHGIATGSNHGFSYHCEEHGFIIGIMSVMPKASYYQGLERFWNRPTRFDYYIPQFAHLGEQEVKNKEVYFDFSQPNTDQGNETFGYQSRYAEYKFHLSTIHGEFRDTLDYWTMARKFSAPPGLNQTFIECDPAKDIFAVPSEPVLMCNLWNDVSAIRPLPYFSNPKL